MPLYATMHEERRNRKAGRKLVVEDIFEHNARCISEKHPALSHYELLQAQATALAVAFRNERHIMPIFVGALEKAGWPESQEDRDQYIGRTMREMTMRMAVSIDQKVPRPIALEPELFFTAFKPGICDSQEAIGRYEKMKNLHDALTAMEKNQLLLDDASKIGSPLFSQIHSLSKINGSQRQIVFTQWINYNRSHELDNAIIRHFLSYILHAMFSPEP